MNEILRFLTFYEQTKHHVVLVKKRRKVDNEKVVILMYLLEICWGRGLLSE